MYIPAECLSRAATARDGRAAKCRWQEGAGHCANLSPWPRHPSRRRAESLSVFIIC